MKFGAEELSKSWTRSGESTSSQNCQGSWELCHQIPEALVEPTWLPLSSESYRALVADIQGLKSAAVKPRGNSLELAFKYSND